MYEVVDKEAGEKLREVLTTEEYEKVLAEGDYQVRMKYFSWLKTKIKQHSYKKTMFQKAYAC